MKTRIQSLSFLASLAVAIGMTSWGGVAQAQTPDQQQPQTQQTSPDAAPSQTPDTQQPPTQAPDQAQSPSSKAGAASATDSQVFSGTVVKTGDKYMLKTDTGKTYDVDHQDELKKFDGKRVRIQGTLDPTGTMIQVK